MIAVAAWTSPVTTAVGVGLMLILLGVLLGRETARQRYPGGRPSQPRRVGLHGPARRSRPGRLVVVLAALLMADILLRFGILTRGH